jgi:uncharacterized membrane protein
MTVLAAVGAGLMAGLLFAFSNFIMKALMRLPPEQGMAAMQHINITILNPVFVLLFFGTAVLCSGLAGYSLLQWKSACSPWLLAGSALYLAGPIGVTLMFNVPLNNALAGAKAIASVAAGAWPAYTKSWLFWNHIRTLASVASALSLTIAAHLCSVA